LLNGSAKSRRKPDFARHPARAGRLAQPGPETENLARTLSAWRSFFNYLARQNAVQANPCLGLRPPKSEKKLPNAPASMPWRILLEAERKIWAVRDLAMFELMYSAGLRRAELIGLDIGGLDLEAGEVTVTGKGSRMRVVPVGKPALLRCATGWRMRANVARGDTQALFVGARGARISATVLALALKQLALRRASPRICIRMRCATPSPAMCCSHPAICARCRKCSATPACRRRRSIPIWTFSIWPGV
jgi:site-specific recombinase XerC